MTTTDRLGQLAAHGVSIWLDDLSRERLRSGQLTKFIRDYHLTGVTTNPTIFAGALASGAAYRDQVRELATRGADVDTAVREITTSDVREACDVFRDVYQSTGGVDGRVSIEVDPRLARDTEATVAEAAELAKVVDRPNLLVKIPATREGLPAITRTLAEGISVNVTLIFSVERYREVIEAFFAGLEQAADNGHDLASVASVASFFVSRVDTEVDKRLRAGDAERATDLLGTAAIANAQLAYATYTELFGEQRWQRLAAAGARPQRPLWASTGVKDPAYRPTRYVDELVVPGTVNTMPEDTLHAVAESAEIAGDVVTGTEQQARAVFDGLRAVGVDLDDVFVTLEDEGVAKFEKSWAELLDTVRAELAAAAGDAGSGR
ncbi:transaldolase [Haloechinothrix sp. LS1_15]|uniref:transaldolase n=1 Tax=Haloechinothrix sp. LS1_15 TaxID=2652248 RepID=UPI00294859FC|nr:transaldolase [Haloechinothrix sp. LS1_15]MDV6013233.1 transaldolase [Haloechinothrix sp. LS1_15]